MSDDSNGRTGTVDARFASVHDDEVRSLERRLGVLAAELRMLRESADIKFDRLTRQGENITDFLRDINAKIDRALNNIDGLDVRNRLAVVEAAVLEGPKTATRVRGRK